MEYLTQLGKVLRQEASKLNASLLHPVFKTELSEFVHYLENYSHLLVANRNDILDFIYTTLNDGINCTLTIIPRFRYVMINSDVPRDEVVNTKYEIHELFYEESQRRRSNLGIDNTPFGSSRKSSIEPEKKRIIWDDIDWKL